MEKGNNNNSHMSSLKTINFNTSQKKHTTNKSLMSPNKIIDRLDNIIIEEEYGKKQ